VTPGEEDEMKAVALVPVRRESASPDAPEKERLAWPVRGTTSVDGGLLARTSRSVETTHLRLTRRGRGLLVTLALVAAVLLGFVGGRANAASDPGPSTVSVVVRPGDTLWSLARGVAEPGEDVRDVVLELQWLNGMDSAALVAGDVIRLPA
jgi:nucleoid-associated protein YgaU